MNRAAGKMNFKKLIRNISNIYIYIYSGLIEHTQLDILQIHRSWIYTSFYLTELQGLQTQQVAKIRKLSGPNITLRGYSKVKAKLQNAHQLLVSLLESLVFVRRKDIEIPILYRKPFEVNCQ